MARIIYGVMGDSLGHVSRGKALAEILSHHEFLFVGGGSASELKRAGRRVVSVPVLGTAIGADRVRLAATLSGILRILPGIRKEIVRIARVIADYRPDLILTDYEFFTQTAARMLQLPCVSLDNQHMLTHCRYEPPRGHRISRWMTLSLIRLFYCAASHYLVTSFCALEPKDPGKTEVLPPIIRPLAEKQLPSNGGHGLIYLRGGLPEGVTDPLARINRSYVVYGLGKRPARGNLSFKPFSDSEFLSDLASCAYLICNGGHSAVSEALYYGKPVLCRPIDLFYEQTVNSVLLSRAGYGDRVTDAEDWGPVLTRFEAGLGRYASQIGQGKFSGNEMVAKRVEKMCRTGAADQSRSISFSVPG